MATPTVIHHHNRDTLQEQMQVIELKHKSNTICSAKWLQSTVNLFNGTTQSCHHCPRHSINVEELAKNPKALHNTEEKAQQRQQMRNGARPEACNYCWSAEDNGAASDRLYKTTDERWSVPHLDRLESDDPDPSYLEVAFDTTCNMKCLYCGPAISSRWMEETLQYGPFDTSEQSHGLGYIYRNKELPIPNNQRNPFKEAFWEWWPTLKHSLTVFRVTGGEPLLSKTMWSVMEDLQREPVKDLTVVVNSNFSTVPGLFDKLLETAKDLEDKIQSFQVTTSAECTGKQQEHIRHGMDYDLFVKNCWTYLGATKRAKLTVTLTVNALSVFSMQGLLEEIYRLRDTYPNRVYISISILHYPPYMDVRVLNKEGTREILEPVREFVRDNGLAIEAEQMDRLIEYAEKPVNDLDLRREDLSIFLEEWDERRGTNYREIFPLLDGLLE